MGSVIPAEMVAMPLSERTDHGPGWSLPLIGGGQSRTHSGQIPMASAGIGLSSPGRHRWTCGPRSSRAPTRPDTDGVRRRPDRLGPGPIRSADGRLRSRSVRAGYASHLSGGHPGSITPTPSANGQVLASRDAGPRAKGEGRWAMGRAGRGARADGRGARGRTARGGSRNEGARAGPHGRARGRTPQYRARME